MDKLLAKKTFYFVGLLYGVAGIAFAALLYARREQAVDMALGRVDAEYHYHASAVATALVAILLLVCFGARKLRAHRHESLGHLLGALLVYDVVALLLGAALVFAGGWVKEIADAMQGKFIDSQDVYADFAGVIRQTGAAFALLLPVHGLLRLIADPFRRHALRALAPAAAKGSLEKLHHVEKGLSANRQQLEQGRRAFGRLDKEIKALEAKFAALRPTDRAGALGQAARAALEARQQASRALAARMAELEADNLRLRHALELARASLAQVPGAGLFVSEADDLVGRSLQYADLAADLRDRVQRTVSRSTDALSVFHPEGLLPSSTDAAPTDPTAEAAPVSAASTPPPEASAPETPAAVDRRAGDDELTTIRQQLRAREQQAGQMEKEIGALRAALETARARIDAADLDRQEALHACLAALKRRVLIVDDDRRLAQMMRQLLQIDGLVEVAIALSAGEAVKILKEETRLPDLILLDIRMPGVSGVEFCAALERSPTLRSIPVVFCSGCPKDTVAELSQLHYADFIQKPFKSDLLRQTVLRFLRVDTEVAENWGTASDPD